MTLRRFLFGLFFGAPSAFAATQPLILISLDAFRHVSLLEDYLDPDGVQVDCQGSVAGLRPLKGTVESMMETLKKLPHADIYRAENLPARFHVQPGPRVPPVWVVPNEGWQVVNRAGFEKTRQQSPDKSYLRGDHGYDPALPTMHDIFIAAGPSFQRCVEIPKFENVHIYNLLLCRAWIEAGA